MNGWTPIHSLSVAGAVEILKSFSKYNVGSKAAFNARDSKGYTPLLALLRSARDFSPSGVCAPVIRDLANEDDPRRTTFPRSRMMVWARADYTHGWILYMYLLMRTLGELSYFFTNSMNNHAVAVFAFADPSCPTVGSLTLNLSFQLGFLDVGLHQLACFEESSFFFFLFRLMDFMAG